MDEKKDNKVIDVHEKLEEQIDKKLEELLKAGVQQNNIDYICKLIEIKKNIKKMEGSNMMYRGYDNYGEYDNYGTYGGGRRRDSQGRYMGEGSYGRRYRGHDMLEDMNETYGTYMANRENGRYGSPETSKSFDYMLKSAEDFFKHLKNEAGSKEEIDKIKMTARRIAEM